MKPEKAIEILSRSVHSGQTTFNQDFKAATKLGIEALKCLEGLKKLPYGSPLPPLPGETTEEEHKKEP